MLEKIQLIILGISASMHNNNAYAVVLQELDGTRKVPIVIGPFEAQAIGIELEGVKPPRPMTHDLLKSVIDGFGATVSEVFIHSMQDSTFLAKIVIEDFGIEIDSRPSDALALAVRCGAPIYIASEILEEIAISTEQNDNLTREDNTQFLKNKKEDYGVNKIEQLKNLLNRAIKDEDYEKAALLRDEIKKLDI